MGLILAAGRSGVIMAKAERIKNTDRYRVRVFFGYNPETGKPIQRARYFRASSQSAANKLAASHETALRKSLETARRAEGTLNGLIDDWWQIKKAQCSPTTMYRITPIIDRIRQRLGDIELDKLTARDIERFYAWLRATPIKTGRGRAREMMLSESTVHHHHRVLSAILIMGERWDRVPIAVTRKVEKPTKGRSKVQPPTMLQIRAAISRADPMMQVVFALAAKTGMRRGELCALRWSDINDIGIWVTGAAIALPGSAPALKATKTDEERLVELDQATRAALLDTWRPQLERDVDAAKPGAKLAADAFVFPDLEADAHGRKPTKPNDISRAWVDACTIPGEDEDGRPIKVRVIRARLHDLRHYAASHLLREGVDIKRVSDQLGHAQTSTTLNIYGHAVGTSGIAAAMAKALPEVVAATDVSS